MSPAAKILSWICRSSAASLEASGQRPPRRWIPRRLIHTKEIEARFTLGGEKKIREKIIF
jgi:hypothetical protein